MNGVSDLYFLYKIQRQSKWVVHVYPQVLIIAIAALIFNSTANFWINFPVVALFSIFQYWFYYFLSLRLFINILPLYFILVSFVCINFFVFVLHWTFSSMILVTPLYSTNVPISYRLGLLYMASASTFIGAFASCNYRFGLFVSIQREKIENEKRRLRIELLQNQMSPHFIFNCLVNLNDSMRTGKTEAAIDYNNSISKLLRIHLENFLKDEITLRTEINWLRLYLEVEQRRLQHSFHFEIHCRDEDMDELSIPPMLLQPIVENSIKHAFSNNGEGSIGKLTITIESPIENTYTVEIADTGKSDIQDNNRDDHQFKKSVAIENIKERIAILHKISPFSITLSALSRPAEFKTKLVIAYNLAH